MSAQTARQAQQHDSWPQLFRRKRYDRTPTLSDVEQATLEQVFRQQLHIRGRTRSALHRLYQPLADVCSRLHTPQPVASRVVRTIFLEMHRRQATFWSWSAETWRECLCQTAHAFAERYGLPLQRRDPARLMLAAVAYLLCPHVSLESLLLIDPSPLANKIFGKDVVPASVKRLRSVLTGWGYRQQSEAHLTTCVSYLLLKNRSPMLDHLSLELLEAAAQECPLTVRRYFFQVSRALQALGIIPQTLPGSGFPAKTYRNTHAMRNELVRRISGRNRVYPMVLGLLEDPMRTQLIPANMA